MPGSAATRTGSRSRSASAGGIRPISGFSPTTGGCRPWNDRLHRRRRRRTRPRSAARRASTAGRGSPTHQPVHAHRHHRLAVDRALPREPLRGDRALLDHADGRVDVDWSRPPSRASTSSPRRASSRARRTTMSIDCMKPWPRIVDHRALRRGLRVLAEQHDLAHDHVGRVVADVGELLGAHVADVAAQRRQHQREPLGDAARVDAGAVQRDAPPVRHAAWSAATPGVSAG